MDMKTGREVMCRASSRPASAGRKRAARARMAAATALFMRPSKPANSRELPSSRAPEALAVAVKVTSSWALPGAPAAGA